MTKYNKKLEDAPYDAGRSNPDYPWVRGEADLGGGSKMTYADPDKPHESYVEEFFHNAGFEIVENADDDKKGLKNKLTHEERSYSSGGSSSHSDGHIDKSTLDSSMRTNVGIDHGMSVAGDSHTGSGGKMISSAQEGIFHDSVNGDTYLASDGAEIKDFKGDINHNIEGDYITSITGNKHTILSSGEYGIHLQGGNMDIQADTGVIRYNSDVKIIISCGDNSTITLEPGKITFKATDILFIKA
jgi:hypothetical protein